MGAQGSVGDRPGTARIEREGGRPGVRSVKGTPRVGRSGGRVVGRPGGLAVGRSGGRSGVRAAGRVAVGRSGVRTGVGRRQEGGGRRRGDEGRRTIAGGRAAPRAAGRLESTAHSAARRRAPSSSPSEACRYDAPLIDEHETSGKCERGKVWTWVHPPPAPPLRMIGLVDLARMHRPCHFGLKQLAPTYRRSTSSPLTP